MMTRKDFVELAKTTADILTLKKVRDDTRLQLQIKETLITFCCTRNPDFSRKKFEAAIWDEMTPTQQTIDNESNEITKAILGI